MATRIERQVQRDTRIRLTVDGDTVDAWAGETLASVLLLRETPSFYRTRSGAPRAPFCNMGTCFECRVQVEQDGRQRWVLACMTPAEPGMAVRTGLVLPQVEVINDAD